MELQADLQSIQELMETPNEQLEVEVLKRQLDDTVCLYLFLWLRLERDIGAMESKLVARAKKLAREETDDLIRILNSRNPTQPIQFIELLRDESRITETDTNDGKKQLRSNILYWKSIGQLFFVKRESLVALERLSKVLFLINDHINRNDLSKSIKQLLEIRKEQARTVLNKVRKLMDESEIVSSARTILKNCFRLQ